MSPRHLWHSSGTRASIVGTSSLVDVGAPIVHDARIIDERHSSCVRGRMVGLQSNADLHGRARVLAGTACNWLLGNRVSMCEPARRAGDEHRRREWPL